MKNSIEYRVCTIEDQPAMADFLYELRHELRIDEKAVAEEIVALLAKHGGAIAGFLNGRMIALKGYFFGDPADGFVDKSLCFVYVAGIAEEFRCSRVFLDAYRFSMMELANRGLKELRCQAELGNPYTNRIYARLLQPKRQTVNRRGLPVMEYSLPFADAARRFAA